MTPGMLIREARRAAGLTQEQLASRMGTTQPAIARLERGGISPTVDTLERALHAVDLDLVLDTKKRRAGADESLIRQHLARSPVERLSGLEAMHREAHELRAAGERMRGRRR